MVSQVTVESSMTAEEAEEWMASSRVALARLREKKKDRRTKMVHCDGESCSPPSLWFDLEGEGIGGKEQGIMASPTESLPESLAIMYSQAVREYDA